MSLHKINEALKKMGLKKKERDQIIEMVREFGMAVQENVRFRIF